MKASKILSMEDRKPQGMEHKEYKGCSLYDIDASTNIRRACPKLTNQNKDPYELIQQLVLVDNNKSQLEFVKEISVETKIVTLAHSILKFGQIHPITVIKNPIDGRPYKNVAGQRRYIACGLIEALIRLQENSKLFNEALEILNNVKACEEEDSNLELTFSQTIIPSVEASFEIKVQLVNLSEEQAEDIAFEENDESLGMSDLDWGYQFDQMLRRINPATGKNYNMLEIAKKRKKHYQFVRTRAALPYLPIKWKEKLDDGSVSIVKAIEKALELKKQNETPSEKIDDKNLIDTADAASKKPVVIDMPDIAEDMDVDADLQAAVISKQPRTAHVDGAESNDDETDLEDAMSEHSLPHVEEAEDEELHKALKKTTRKKKVKDIRLSVADIVRLIVETDRSNIERIKALGETIRYSLHEAQALTLDDIQNLG